MAAKDGSAGIAPHGDELTIQDVFMSPRYPVERLRTQPYFTNGNPKVRFGRKDDENHHLTDDQSRELSRQAWIALARRGTRAERMRLARSFDLDIAKAARDSLVAEDGAKDGQETA